MTNRIEDEKQISLFIARVITGASTVMIAALYVGIMILGFWECISHGS